MFSCYLTSSLMKPHLILGCEGSNLDKFRRDHTIYILLQKYPKFSPQLQLISGTMALPLWLLTLVLNCLHWVKHKFFCALAIFILIVFQGSSTKFELNIGVPITTEADNNFDFFYLFIFFKFYFSEKISLDISCELSAWQMIHMKYQDFFFSEKSKKKKKSKILGCHLLRILPGTLRVKSVYLIIHSFAFTIL